jgi:carbon-monoxide dehydrogenase medium subunit
LKPPPFEYHRAATRDEVDALLATYGDEAKILAGGQSLVPMLNFRLAHPAHLIDINHLENEATEPKAADGWVSFGPVVRQVAAESSAPVRESVPLLHEALSHVAHPAIRTRGTIVGSIAHADPAAEMPAVLAALGGEVLVRSDRGRRTIVGGDFFTGPLDNALEMGEWVDEIRFPEAAGGDGFAFEEFARRSGDYALCGVAARASGEGDAVEISLTYLGVGVTPQTLTLPARSRADLAATSLEDDIGSAVSEGLSPYDDIHATADYKRFLAVSLGTRAARRAGGATL